MKNRNGLLVTVILILIVLLAIGYVNRGRIRIALLAFLHSFDDTEEVEPARESSMPGLWSPARDGGISADSAAQQEQERQELLHSLGYLSGYEDAPLENGVTVFYPDRTSPGYNIVTSAHMPGASMMDMEGNTVHEWYVDERELREAWPDAADMDADFDFWRRVYLCGNGDMLAIISGAGLFKLDSESNLLWTSDLIGAHHDADIGDDGLIYVIGRKVHINENYNSEDLIAEDFLYTLDSLGNTIAEVSILDMIASSPYAPNLRKAAIRNGLRLAMRGQLSPVDVSDIPLGGDVLHCNSVSYIREGQLPDGYDGPFREGTVILSCRIIDLVLAADLQTGEIYWAESDLWHAQHEPVLLPDGNLMVFDNLGTPGASRVVEIDPLSRNIEWLYSGSEEDPFYTLGIGSCQRFPNGNTLITESMFGRAFEVTPEGETVWEYYNPHRSGENSEFIATLHEVFRVDSDYVDGWFE
jgi:hypothetical protein